MVRYHSGIVLQQKRKWIRLDMIFLMRKFVIAIDYILNFLCAMEVFRCRRIIFKSRHIIFLPVMNESC